MQRIVKKCMHLKKKFFNICNFFSELLFLHWMRIDHMRKHLFIKKLARKLKNISLELKHYCKNIFCPLIGNYIRNF